MRRFWTWAILLTALALGTRFWVAFAVTSDSSGDGPIYQRIAQNLLEHGVYSAAEAAPYAPTYIRMPGYPLLIAAVFAVFGNGNHTALLSLQVLADTLTCWLAALLCLIWLPGSWGRFRRHVAALSAFALYALCPYTVVYTGTVLTETWALLFGTLCAVTGSWALRGGDRPLARWAATGLAGGVACLFRPDMGLCLAALGLVLLLKGVRESAASGGAPRWARWRVPARGVLLRGLVFSAAFAAVLVPWTLRNALTLHRFMPLAPPHANMPDEYVQEGYFAWVRTWITRPRDVEYFLWPLEEKAMDPSGLPPSAIGSPEERQRVAELFSLYNRGLDPGAGPEAASGNPFVLSRALDAEFGRLARERAAAHPLRQYLLLPARRAWNLWFDTHSIYYPFDGYLGPLRELEPRTLEGWLLPLFYLLVWAYTALGLWGARVLWRSPGCRDGVLLAGLLFLPRLAFLASLENPEPRYMVEMFPVVAALGGACIASWVKERGEAGEAS